jgi:hypothetical protein
MQLSFFFPPKRRDFALLSRFELFSLKPGGKPESREKDADARKFVSSGPIPAQERRALHRISRRIGKGFSEGKRRRIVA